MIDVPPDSPAVIEIGGNDVLPIRWMRDGRTRATLPIVLLPTAGSTVELAGQQETWTLETHTLPRVRVEPRVYSDLVAWDETPTRAARVRILLLACAFAGTVLLAWLSPRRRVLIAIGVCLVWAGGLSWWLSRRPTLLWKDEVAVSAGVRCVMALAKQTVRVPVTPDGRWMPVVESTRHLRDLAPRVVVQGDAASIEVTLAERGKIAFAAPPREQQP